MGDFQFGRWFSFGFKYSVLWGLLALAIVALFGTAIGGMIGVDLAWLIAFGLILGLVVVFVSALVMGVIWAVIGFIYENLLEGWFTKLPTWTQLGLIGSVTGAIQGTVASGGTGALVLVAALVPIVVIAFIQAVISLWAFEKLDWDIPLHQD